MKKIIMIPLLLAFLIPSISWGADFYKGLVAYKNGDFATSLREWIPLAEQGNFTVQFNLGVMYGSGIGVPQNDNTAVKWYARSAEQGYTSAQKNLSIQYALGQGVIKDYVQSLMWANIAQYNGTENTKKLIKFLVRRMTQEQIARAQDLAQECIVKDYKGC